MLTDHDKDLIANLFRTDWGQALEVWLRDEISLLEEKEKHGLKISTDPLHEDFRWQLGLKMGLKMVLDKPRECFNELKKQGG